MSGLHNPYYIPTQKLDVFYNLDKDETIRNNLNIVYKTTEIKYNTNIFNWITLPINIDTDNLNISNGRLIINLIPKKNNGYKVYTISTFDTDIKLEYKLIDNNSQNINCSFVVNSKIYKIKIEFMENNTAKISWLY